MKMPWPLWLFIAGFVGGNLLSWPLGAGVRITFLDVSVVILLLYCGLRDVSGKRHIPTLSLPILLFACVSLASLGVAAGGGLPYYVTGGGLLYVLRWLTYAGLYWAASSSVISSSAWRWALGIAGFCMAVLGFVQLVLYPDLRNLMYLGWDPHYQRLFGTLLDPNFTGIILAATALLTLGMGSAKQLNAWQISIVGVVTAALLFTFSRSSMLGLAVGLITWGVLTRNSRFVLGVLGIFLVVLVFVPWTGEGRNLLRTASTYARFGNVERAVSLIAERPVLGYGFNTLRFIATERSWIDERIAPSRAGAGLDTSILFVGATTGLVGLALYLWLWLRLVKEGVMLNMSDPMRAAYLASLAAIAVHSLFINSLFYPWVMAWIWILLGSITARK